MQPTPPNLPDSATPYPPSSDSQGQTETDRSAAVFIHVALRESADIVTLRLDPSSETMSLIGRVAAGPMVMPLALRPDGRFLYAALRAPPYRVLSYRIDPQHGHLTPVGIAPLPANWVGMTVDHSGRWLLGVDYAGATLSVQALDVQGQADVKPGHLQPSAGLNPHAVRIDRSNRFVYVCHLGTDDVSLYLFDADTGFLQPHPQVRLGLPAGTGPRHLVFSPDQRFLYVLGELDGVLHVLQRDLRSGGLTHQSSQPSLPSASRLRPGLPRVATGTTPGMDDLDDRIWCADVQITPDGRHLYTSERSDSTLSMFQADPASGALQLLGQIPSERQPRALAIDPEGQFLVASGEASRHLSLYRIRQPDGYLDACDRLEIGYGASWVLMSRSSVPPVTGMCHTRPSR